MSDYLQIVQTERETNEGYTFQIPDRDLLDTLITEHNKLVEYIAKRDKLEKSRWSEEYKLPEDSSNDT